MTGPAGSPRLFLGFVGDVCLSFGVIDVVRKRGPKFMFESVRPPFDQLDLVISNLRQ